jgi:hypothetical protein
MKATVVLRMAVLAVGAAGGCGGGGGTADGLSGNPISLSQLPAVWANTICNQNFKCASPEDIMMRTKKDCVDTNMQTWSFLVPSIQDSQSKGRSTYDAAQMGLCIKALASETCDEWVTGLTHDIGCPEAFTAKVVVGGACQNDSECIGGICDGADLQAMPPVDGMCKARVAHGAACTFADTCAMGDYCDSDAKSCTGKKAGGTACTATEQCGNDCNTDTNKCSGYAGCAVAPVTPRSTLLSIVGIGLVVMGARARRRRVT